MDIKMMMMMMVQLYYVAVAVDLLMCICMFVPGHSRSNWILFRCYHWATQIWRPSPELGWLAPGIWPRGELVSVDCVIFRLLPDHD